MNEQNVYTDVQMEILRHIDKYGVLPHGVNHDDTAKLTKAYLIRLAGVSEARVMLYRLRPGGSELLKESPAPTDLATLQAELKRLKAALAFYADEANNHREITAADGQVWPSEVAKDGGLRAQQALAGEEPVGYVEPVTEE